MFSNIHGREQEAVTLDGIEPDYHHTPLVFAKSMDPEKVYRVNLEKLHLRPSGGDSIVPRKTGVLLTSVKLLRSCCTVTCRTFVAFGYALIVISRAAAVVAMRNSEERRSRRVESMLQMFRSAGLERVAA